MNMDFMFYWAVPWLRRLPVSHHGDLGFNPRPVHVGFVVDKVAMGQVFLQVLRYSPVSIVPPLLHIPSLSTNNEYITLYDLL
jgi:hypothetical protein